MPDVTHVLRRWLGWSLNPEHARRVALLERAPLFAGLSRRQLGRLAARFFEKGYEPGDVVFQEGDHGAALFVILEGAVVVTHGEPDGQNVLHTLGLGACFGELALIDDAPRSASARVTAPSRLLILYKTDFDALVEGNRRIALVVMRNLLRALATYARRAPRGQPEHPAVPEAPVGRAPGLSVTQ